MTETWVALVCRSSYGNHKQTHGVWLGRARRDRGQARPGQVLGTAEQVLGRKAHQSSDEPAELTEQWEMGVVSWS